MVNILSAVLSLVLVWFCWRIFHWYLSRKALEWDASVNGIGLRSKLCYLLGIGIPKLYEAQYQWYPYKKESKKEDQSYTLKEALSVLQAKTITPQKCLVISFSGGAIKIGGYSQIEFRRVLSECVTEIHNDDTNYDDNDGNDNKEKESKHEYAFDQLYVLDPTGMSWYSYVYDKTYTSNWWDGWKVLGKNLREILKHYKYCLYIGNCMGGTGALIASSYVPENITRCHVVTFNPHLSPSTHPEWAARLGSWLLPSRLRNGLLQACTASVVEAICNDKCPTKVLVSIHVSGFIVSQAEAFVAFWKQACLASINQSIFENQISSVSPITSQNAIETIAGIYCPVHVVIHNDHAIKGGLVRFLRDNGDLAIWIRAHLQLLLHQD
ncbi:hypothetical protein RFI_08537 [Reticulomyxa filosa]|uniref:Uncharacterized protein n=1 Tax=Reticulomyxa filosa TaxID=46433 RepID=X6NRM3_RETFI|nr:hypothetical protein RFI_08537 [Reticulomyxa filosa]|eukprot:ETO28593.1 hypothetical protein RFI_08537 [Reticulomyxa filosa]